MTDLLVDELGLAAPGKADDAEAAPFLTVERTDARVRWRSLLTDRIVAESIAIESPYVDLTAPLPDLADVQRDSRGCCCSATLSVLSGNRERWLRQPR